MRSSGWAAGAVRTVILVLLAGVALVLALVLAAVLLARAATNESRQTGPAELEDRSANVAVASKEGPPEAVRSHVLPSATG